MDAKTPDLRKLAEAATPDEIDLNLTAAAKAHDTAVISAALDEVRIAAWFETAFCKEFPRLEPEDSYNVVEWMHAEGAAALRAALLEVKP